LNTVGEECARRGAASGLDGCAEEFLGTAEITLEQEIDVRREDTSDSIQFRRRWQSVINVLI
jgi:hypothetical protein